MLIAGGILGQTDLGARSARVVEKILELCSPYRRDIHEAGCRISLLRVSAHERFLAVNRLTSCEDAVSMLPIDIAHKRPSVRSNQSNFQLSRKALAERTQSGREMAWRNKNLPPSFTFEPCQSTSLRSRAPTLTVSWFMLIILVSSYCLDELNLFDP